MMPRPHRTAPVRTTLRLAGLLAVLAGLFGMHGLASHHGTALEHGAHGVIAVASGPVAGAMPDTQAPPGAEIPQGTGLELAGLCIVLLAMGLGAILLRRVRPRTLVWWALPRGGSASTVLRLRDPAPPSLTLLSVQRC